MTPIKTREDKNIRVHIDTLITQEGKKCTNSEIYRRDVLLADTSGLIVR